MGFNLDKPFGDQSIEGTDELKLDFGKLGKLPKNVDCIPVAVQNAVTGEVILIAYINEAALSETIKHRKAVFWSTSRNELWFKGKESGNTFAIDSIYVNCEQNSLVFKVIPDKGDICHTSINNKANNCYYRKLNLDTLKLELA